MKFCTNVTDDKRRKSMLFIYLLTHFKGSKDVSNVPYVAYIIVPLSGIPHLGINVFRFKTRKIKAEFNRPTFRYRNGMNCSKYAMNVF